MDEFFCLVLHGIKLAKDLEQTLQNLATRQEMLPKLDEIIRAFLTARETLNGQDPSLYHHQMLFHDQLQQTQIDQSLQDQYWLRNKSMTGSFQTQPQRKSSSSGGGMDQIVSRGGLAMELGGSADVQAMASSSSSQRPRRRKDDTEKKKITVPAPSMGNTEIPPEDGYTWRKYGQKEILGSKFPRSYYRCTHQKLYHCPAKKQVQRLDNDPDTFEITYRGDHSCYMSSTAPSIPPPARPEITREVTQRMAAHPPPWLEFSLGAGGGGGGGGGSSSSGAAGPSTVRYGREADYPVADWADVMFNSGTSSSNSMELIFTTMGDKWEQEDKKN